MDPKLFFGIASAVFAIFSGIPYVRDILQNETRPHAYSWLVWSILQAIGTIAQWHDGAGYGAWALAIAATVSTLVFLLSFKYGTRNITRFDTACLIAALIALILYLTMDDPLTAVIAIIIVDLFGFLPTFRKGWQEPETETVSTYALSGLANFLALFALQQYTLVTMLYIASLFLTNASFVIMILLRKKILQSMI